MQNAPSTPETYPSNTRHPEWCDRNDCETRSSSGSTEHVSPYWDVATGNYGIRMAVQQYEGEGLSPLIRIVGKTVKASVRCDQVQPLVESLQRAAALLARPAVPAPTVNHTTAPDGSRTVTVTTSVTHPEWCDLAACIHEDSDTHPVHQSAEITMPGAGRGFCAAIRQDGPDEPTIWSHGPHQDTDMTPAQVRAYAAGLLALADRIDPQEA